MDELYLKKLPCGDCGVKPDEQHLRHCDVARCKLCGWQNISCPCVDLERDMTVWTGIWPGTIECIEYDLFSYWGPPWIECGKDHPGAGPDYNALGRLHAAGEFDWDSERERLIATSERV